MGLLQLTADVRLIPFASDGFPDMSARLIPHAQVLGRRRVMGDTLLALGMGVC